MQHDIFISYSSKDEAIAHEIVAGLERQGISCWIASYHITPSNTYASEIMNNLKNAKLVLLILSESSNSSKMVEREIERAVSLHIPILPIMIEEVEPSLGMEFLISSIQWFPAFGLKPKSYIEKLSNTILSIIGQYPERLQSKKKSKSKHSKIAILSLLSLLFMGGIYQWITQTQEHQACPKTYPFGTAAIVGNYYKVADNLKKVNQDQCIKFDLKKTQGSLDNALQLIRGDLEIGITQMDTLQIHPYLNRNIGVLSKLYHEEMHIIVRKESNLTGFSQLKGKRIDPGEKKSGSSVTAIFLYEYFFKEKMINPIHTQLSEALDLLREGDIDAIITVVGSPAAAFHKRKMNSFKLIPFDLNLSDTLKEKYQTSSIKYAWMMNKVESISTITVLIAKEKHQEDSHLKTFIERLNGSYREKLIANATNDINTPLMKWYDRITSSKLPQGLHYHSLVADLYKATAPSEPKYAHTDPYFEKSPADNRHTPSLLTPLD